MIKYFFFIGQFLSILLTQGCFRLVSYKPLPGNFLAHFCKICCFDVPQASHGKLSGPEANCTAQI